MKAIILLGAPGAGKSTFANLVPRFYDTTAGAVLVDGIPSLLVSARVGRETKAVVI